MARILSIAYGYKGMLLVPYVMLSAIIFAASGLFVASMAFTGMLIGSLVTAYVILRLDYKRCRRCGRYYLKHEVVKKTGNCIYCEYDILDQRKQNLEELRQEIIDSI